MSQTGWRRPCTTKLHKEILVSKRSVILLHLSDFHQHLLSLHHSTHSSITYSILAPKVSDTLVTSVRLEVLMGGGGHVTVIDGSHARLLLENAIQKVSYRYS
ncbi:hypothetical protein EVAR_67155_1 [Eumeta japonica]|uniref:Uncharacterized protein n=1 Tax=Eumeta variegata TaxID=151549 RepID=A0A4C1ZT73_EUMVA|nr:hypothetical protein EVAR_67155_1 [Eumeta japonica]